MSQFVAEIQQIFMHLDCLVKSDDFLVMVSNGHDEATAIALVDQTLNHVPASIEFEHFLKCSKLDILEEVLALLEHPDGQSFLDEGAVLGKIGHALDGLLKGLPSLFADIEGRIFSFDQPGKLSYGWVVCHEMDLLSEDLLDQLLVRCLTTDHEHFTDLLELLSDNLRVLKVFPDSLWQVVGGETLKLDQSVVD